MPWYPRQYLPQLREAVDCAPSIFNQRPWELTVADDDDDRLELYSVPNAVLADSGLLREAVISCGAALYNLRLAIRVAGRRPTVWLLPGLDHDTGLLETVHGKRTLLASVEVMPGRAVSPTDAEQELYEALWLRRTDRGPYRYQPVPPPILVEMEVAAAHERGWLRTLTPAESKRTRRAAAKASKDLDASKELHERLSVLRSAVPRQAYGPTPKDVEEAPVRPDFCLPEMVEPFERHPVMMALSTDDDRPLDWLRAGQALQHALLTGTRFSMSVPGGRSAPYRQPLAYGPLDPHRLRPRPRVPTGYAVEASFLTQFLELADLRGRARSWPWQANYTEVPQIVLRVGYAPVAGGLSAGDSYSTAVEERPQIPAEQRVETYRGLVEDQPLRSAEQGDRQADAGELIAGECSDDPLA
jgi:hypothetical protein